MLKAIVFAVSVLICGASEAQGIEANATKVTTEVPVRKIVKWRTHPGVHKGNLTESVPSARRKQDNSTEKTKRVPVGGEVKWRPAPESQPDRNCQTPESTRFPKRSPIPPIVRDLRTMA